MGIKTKAKTAIKRTCRILHLDGVVKKMWHKTSRYQLRICEQEFARIREAEALRRREEEERQAQIDAEERALAAELQRKQRYANHILRLAESVKSMLEDTDSVCVYQYFYLDEKGEKCFNGGAERYVRDLTALIAQHGQSVTLLQVGDAESMEPWRRERDGLRIIGIPCTFHEYADVVEQLPSAKLNVYSGYLRFGKLHHPNIMISHGVTWDSFGENADVEALEKRLDGIDTLASVDTNTISWLRSTFAKRLEDQPCDMRYIPNYADLNVFFPLEEKRADENVHIVFPRRATPQRGFWQMAEVLPRLMVDYPNVTFDFVGFVHLPDIAERIDGFVSSYGGRVRCYMTDADEMPSVYQRADISVIPTRCTEGTSLSAIETMACGSAVVCTNVGGLPNLVINGFNGLMVNPDSEELYTAISRLIMDKVLRETLAQNALKVVKCFSKNAWDERWTTLLGQKLSERQVHRVKHHTRVLATACALYQGDAYQGYLNALYWAKQNGWLVLAPESYVNRPLQYEAWMFDFHNMQCVTEEERRAIPHLLFPDSLFDMSEQEGRSWTERNLDLFRYRNAQMEESLQAQIDDYLSAHPDTDITSFLMYGESYRSVREIAERYGANVYSYEFSTVRAYKGFSQTLLFCSTDGKAFYHSGDPQKRYQAFCNENSSVPMLSRRELIALFYLFQSYPLIPLLDTAPRDEMGVCLGGGLCLPVFNSSKYLDEDVMREVTSCYSIDHLPRRTHPAATMSAIERSRISLDPVPFLLSCRRIAACASNTSFEAMLWNRTAYSRGMNMPFSFMCTQNPTDSSVVEEKFLNWFLFGYCVPGHARLFSEEYWRWRETRPTETEIYLRHQSVILNALGITEDTMALPEKERFVKIMEKRGYSGGAQEQLLQNWENRAALRPFYDHLQSYVNILDAKGSVYAKYEGINLQTDEGIVSRFAMEADTRRERIDFCPLQECVGFVHVLRAGDGKRGYSIAAQDQGFRCMEQHATIPVTGEGIGEPMVLEVVWEMREVSLENLSNMSYREPVRG